MHVYTPFLNAAIEVHRTLGGPGLLESLYETELAVHKAQVLTYLRLLILSWDY